jgi:hypothetical protein
MLMQKLTVLTSVWLTLEVLPQALVSSFENIPRLGLVLQPKLLEPTPMDVARFEKKEIFGWRITV